MLVVLMIKDTQTEQRRFDWACVAVKEERLEWSEGGRGGGGGRV